MGGNKKERFKNILKTSSRFILGFILLTILYALLNIGIFVYLSDNLPFYKYIPVQQSLEPTTLNWEEIHKLGGYGYLVDNAGNILWQSQGSGEHKSMSVGDILDQNLTRGNHRASFTYTTPEGNWLILNYPSDTFSNEPTYNFDAAPASQQRMILTIVIVLMLLYLLGIFFLFHRLSARLEANVQEIYRAEEENKRFFFRGLVHDVKTPLATIMAFSRAIADSLVQAEKVNHYLDTIYRQSDVLKSHLDDMIIYATLEEQIAENMQKADLLEAIRRYAGENYTWFSQREARIEIRFHDDETYLTSFDQSLLSRMLQNLLNNSVEHNKPGVCIYIDWDPKVRCLTVGDDGSGIPEALHDTLFDPMVTGDHSRTREHFIGMGLANVKRIVQLHGWEIDYEGEFRIKIS